MKLNIITIVTLAIFGSNFAHAQFVGGGGAAPLQPTKAQSNSPWKNRFCLYAGPSLPIGVWNRDPNPSASLTDPYTNNTGFGASSGFYFDMGSMFYLKRLKLPEEMGVAITTTWINFSTNKFSWSNLGEDYLEDGYFFDGRFFLYSMKFGAQYSYTPIKKLCVDAYFNFAPTFGFIPGVRSGNSDANYEFSTLTTLTRGMRRNIGINVRYSVFTVGIDYIFGGLKTVLYSEVYDNRTNSYVFDDTSEIRFRANALAIKLGFTL